MFNRCYRESLHWIIYQILLQDFTALSKFVYEGLVYEEASWKLLNIKVLGMDEILIKDK